MYQTALVKTSYASDEKGVPVVTIAVFVFLGLLVSLGVSLLASKRKKRKR